MLLNAKRLTPGSRILLSKNLCSARFAHQGDRERVPLEGPAEGAGGDGGLVAQVVAGEGSDQGEGAEGGLGGVGGPGLRALQGGWSWQSYGIAKVQANILVMFLLQKLIMHGFQAFPCKILEPLLRSGLQSGHHPPTCPSYCSGARHCPAL